MQELPQCVRAHIDLMIRHVFVQISSKMAFESGFS
jgi:hypothetical protein